MQKEQFILLVIKCSLWHPQLGGFSALFFSVSALSLPHILCQTHAPVSLQMSLQIPAKVNLGTLRSCQNQT